MLNPDEINNRSIPKFQRDQKNVYLQGQLNAKRVKNLQQLIVSAKAETKMLDTEYQKCSKDNQHFWHRCNKQGIKLETLLKLQQR